MAEAVIGGTLSEATGGKFGNGAITAAMQFALNQMQERRWESRFAAAREYLNEVRPQLMAGRYLTVDDANQTFALKFSGVSGKDGFWIEFGANIMPVATPDGTRFRLNYTVMSRTIDRFGAGSSVNIPYREHAVAWTHTHPNDWTYRGSGPFSYGNVSTFVDRLPQDAYVNLPNGDSDRIMSQIYYNIGGSANSIYYNQDGYMKSWGLR